MIHPSWPYCCLTFGDLRFCDPAAAHGFCGWEHSYQQNHLSLFEGTYLASFRRFGYLGMLVKQLYFVL